MRTNNIKRRCELVSGPTAPLSLVLVLVLVLLHLLHLLLLLLLLLLGKSRRSRQRGWGRDEGEETLGQMLFSIVLRNIQLVGIQDER